MYVVHVCMLMCVCMRANVCMSACYLSRKSGVLWDEAAGTGTTTVKGDAIVSSDFPLCRGQQQ